ncbi:ATP-binding protein [Bacillaceae bacterium C204]|uniref:ATP-binding protein n=1 Tax=Neobacillus sp. 204 TaxID=3383351 RepID=UPI00397BF257
MRTIGQVIQSEIFQSTSLGKETCEGCGQEVEIVEVPIIGGPNKGKLIQMKKGCICEDIQLAKETLEVHERLKSKKLLEVFDTYSLVPPELREATMNDYQPKNKAQAAAKQGAVDYVRHFDPKKPANLIFYGPYGTGKSHLARCVSRGVMQMGYSTIFISVPKLLRKLKSTYNKDSEVTEDKLISALETVDLLVLDDIGAESETKWVSEKLFDIVDSRQGKSTLYTTNLYPEQLLERDERNFSRVLNNDTSPFELEGENYRLRKFR